MPQGLKTQHRRDLCDGQLGHLRSSVRVRARVDRKYRYTTDPVQGKTWVTSGINPAYFELELVLALLCRRWSAAHLAFSHLHGRLRRLQDLLHR